MTSFVWRKGRSNMYFLTEKGYSEDGDELYSKPILCSKKMEILERYLSQVTKVSREYDLALIKHVNKCKKIIRDYLSDNLDAITGWRDVRDSLKTSYPVTHEEKLVIINFLCANYAYSYGENIVYAKYDNSFIPRYCDVSKLKKPYPKLPKSPVRPDNYKDHNNFVILEVDELTEK